MCHAGYPFSGAIANTSWAPIADGFPTRRLPLLYFTFLRLLYTDDLVAIQQTERIERLLDLDSNCQHGLLVSECKVDGAAHLAHRIDCRLAQLVREIVTLDQPDAVFAL